MPPRIARRGTDRSVGLARWRFAAFEPWSRWAVVDSPLERQRRKADLAEFNKTYPAFDIKDFPPCRNVMGLDDHVDYCWELYEDRKLADFRAWRAARGHVYPEGL
jgi:hypothetical protein